MRPLTEDESKAVFAKLANYIVIAVAFPSVRFFTLVLGQKPSSPN